MIVNFLIGYAIVMTVQCILLKDKIENLEKEIKDLNDIIEEL